MRLYHQSVGDGDRTVALLHGLFGQGSNLLPVARSLDLEFRSLLPDLRNHGRSPHAQEMSYSLMADDLRALLDQAEVERADLIGHSMGGKVAMQFALDYPQRVRSLIVADIAPVKYPPHHDEILAALFALRDRQPVSRREAQLLLDPVTGDSGVTAFLLMNWVRKADGGYDWRFNLDALQNNYQAISAAPEGRPYQKSVLFIKGENSDYITSAHRSATTALFPGARMKVIAGTGHWLHAEKPAVFTRLVSAFLASRGQ